MNGVNEVVDLWRDEALIVLAVLAGFLFFHYATKLWSAPADAVMGAILGAAIGMAGAGLFLTRHMWGIALSPRASWFIVLYIWCVMVMIFFAARHTTRTKLALGLASQAGILYALFLFL